MKLVASVISGALQAIHLPIVPIETMHYATSGQAVMTALLGGMGPFFGPFIGAATFSLLQDGLSTLTGHRQLFVGAIFIAVVLFLPLGLWGEVLARLRRRRRPTDPPRPLPSPPIAANRLDRTPTMIERRPSPSRPAARLPLLALALAILVAACSDDGAERRRALGDSPAFAEVMRVADAARGGRLFGSCAACHPVGPGAGDRNGPNLYGVVGKPPAETSPRFGYTAALRSLGGVWTPERLDAWLAAPAAMVPGTSMTLRGVPDPLDRADLIAYLQERSGRPRGSPARTATPAPPGRQR